MILHIYRDLKFVIRRYNIDVWEIIRYENATSLYIILEIKLSGIIVIYLYFIMNVMQKPK